MIVERFTQIESEMRQRDLFIEEPRLFEALCSIEMLEAGFRRVKKNKVLRWYPSGRDSGIPDACSVR